MKTSFKIKSLLILIYSWKVIALLYVSSYYTDSLLLDTMLLKDSDTHASLSGLEKS